MGKQFIDLTGHRFGMLTVVHRVRPKKGSANKACWGCVCDCGEKRVCSTDVLKSGVTKSCGCARGEYVAAYHKNRRDTLKGD